MNVPFTVPGISYKIQCLQLARTAMWPERGSGALRRTLIRLEELIKVHGDSLDGIPLDGGVLANFIEPDSGIWEAIPRPAKHN